jgi:hypothetical protein
MKNQDFHTFKANVRGKLEGKCCLFLIRQLCLAMLVIKKALYPSRTAAAGLEHEKRFYALPAVNISSRLTNLIGF